MRGLLVPLAAALLLMGCPAKEGAKTEVHLPGGPEDRSEQHPGLSSAQEDLDLLAPEKMRPDFLADRYEAGGGWLSPDLGPSNVVRGSVAAVQPGVLRVASEGQQVELGLGQHPLTTWHGSLISVQVIPEGAPVRALFHVDPVTGQKKADRIELLTPPAHPFP
ncbi:hypothetical protein [Vulgatibacter incomptus]|uniref:Lipoprotein n=1 Tax=Vulgatibacter incomptus TaxID=1391653 RepID=A0A0K1P8F0_9BACT|nr:hypothetical protein [Vulgatibacter incomptus]AKU89803.1 hypothetical protein AKJ08_0190 [Vulgatibacter incomptus]